MSSVVAVGLVEGLGQVNWPKVALVLAWWLLGPLLILAAAAFVFWQGQEKKTTASTRPLPCLRPPPHACAKLALCIESHTWLAGFRCGHLCVLSSLSNRSGVLLHVVQATLNNCPSPNVTNINKSRQSLMANTARPVWRLAACLFADL